MLSHMFRAAPRNRTGPSNARLPLHPTCQPSSFRGPASKEATTWPISGFPVDPCGPFRRGTALLNVTSLEFALSKMLPMFGLYGACFVQVSDKLGHDFMSASASALSIITFMLVHVEHILNMHRTAGLHIKTAFLLKNNTTNLSLIWSDSRHDRWLWGRNYWVTLNVSSAATSA